MAILESILLLLLVFRWVFAIAGTISTFLLAIFRHRWLNTRLKWIILFLIILMSAFVLFSLYLILVIDYDIPLPVF